MSARQHSASVYNSLKTAFKMLIADLGGLDAAASCTRVKRSNLSDYGAPGKDFAVPSDVIADLETVAGAPRMPQPIRTAMAIWLSGIFCGNHER